MPGTTEGDRQVERISVTNSTYSMREWHDIKDEKQPYYFPSFQDTRGEEHVWLFCVIVLTVDILKAKAQEIHYNDGNKILSEISVYHSISMGLLHSGICVTD